MAGVTADLNNEDYQVDTSLDNVVIAKVLMAKNGGATLKVTGFTPSVIKAGHLIITDATGKEYSPMPIASSGTAYDTLPVGSSYAGVLIATIPTKRPFAAVLQAGKVNEKAAPFPYPNAAKTALGRIIFTED